MMKSFSDYINESPNSRALAAFEKQNLRQLKQTLDGSGLRGCFIFVKWNEPDDRNGWREENAYGPFDEGFFDWLDKHWDYWQDKANVSVSIEEIHKDKKSNRRSW